MDSMTNVEEYREFLDYFKAHVDPNDQLPVKVPGYSLLEQEIPGEVVNWVQQYLLQMKCPEVLLAPIVHEVLQETKKSYAKMPMQCGFDGYVYNPLKLSTIVISHTNSICERLLDNAELNEILTKSSASVLSHTPRHCVKAIKNGRRKMEDRHVCFSDFNGMFDVKDSEPTSFYGVFDGHGGQDAAFYTAAHLCHNIAKSSKYPHNVEGALKEAFLKTDEAFVDKSDKYSMYSGTTAVVCIYRAIEKRLFVGWVGDSQALLVCEGKVCQIVSPHVPSDESERNRIEGMGGVILMWSGNYRVNGQLAVSRAIGDAPHKPFISGKPDVSSISLEGKEDFLIIASDGLWESLTEDYIALFVYRQIAENPDCADSIADQLIESARKGTSDNITVVVVFFKDPHLIAKSTWLNKMEAAYDKSNTNSAFDNDSSLFKFNNMDSGLTITSDMSVLNDTNEHQAKNSYNDTNDTHIAEESSADVVGNHQRFVDDFGPETDVDGLEDSHAAKSPVEFHKTDSITEYDFTNGVKPFSLENKIIQQLSEQNGDFLTDSNPFKNDHFDQFNDENTLDDQLLDQPIKIDSDESAAMVVDNKIIDALESLGITNGEKEKHDAENVRPECDLIDDTCKSPEFPDLTEKVDYSHEKHVFSPDTPAVPEGDFMHYSENTFDQTIHQEVAPQAVEQAYTPVLAETGCVEGSVGEESEEEEDEWNYIKGDKKSEDHQEEIEATEENHNPSEPAATETDTVQSEEEQTADLLVETASPADTHPLPGTQLLDVEPAETFEEDGQPIETANEVIEAEPLESTNQTEQEEFTEQEVCAEKELHAELEVSAEQELDHQEREAVLIKEEPIASEEAAIPNSVSFSASPIPHEEVIDQQPISEVDPNLLAEDISRPESVQEQKDIVEEISEEHATSNKEEVAPEEQEEVLAPPVEIELEESKVEQSEEQPEQEEAVEAEIPEEDIISEELERPNSLSFEMASRLNPEAKEFVPTGSPTRSGPTSPVAGVPTLVQNSLLLLDDDTVIAQSPKKCSATMDNIDVPAEDDFQHEMDNRPHELEKSSEYINGNTDGTVRSHSPASEPSYQELNLKEAMQADEKLEYEYNDEKQTATEDSSSEALIEKNLLNVLNKEQDPMNMSFYEGRDEALLSSNSDELNKVHMLPDDEEDLTDQAIVDVQTETTTEVECTEKQQENLLDVHMDTQESEVTSQLLSESLEPSAKTPVQEEPSPSIFAVASQVVNDVAALVDEMQIEAPVTTNGHDVEMESSEEPCQEEVLVENTESSADIVKTEETQDILVSLESQHESKPIEDALDVDQSIESPHPIAMEDDVNLHTAETEELLSPTVETVQQEVLAENEFITDESVINVPTPTPIICEQSSPVASPIMPEPVKEETVLPVVEESVPIEPVVQELIKPEVSPVIETVIPPVPEAVESTPIIEKLNTEVTPAVCEIPAVSVVSKSTTKSAATSKTAPLKAAPAATKSLAKTTSAGTDKKTTTTAKPLAAKPTTKSAVLSKSTTTAAAVKKTTTVSSASSTTKAAPAKPTPAGRTSTIGSTATSKPAIEKKAPLAAKKPTTAVNGDVKPASATAARKPLTSTVKSTTVKSTTSTLATGAKPSSASVRSTTTTTKTSTVAAKTPASAPARPSSATTTTRTTSTVSAAPKPRAAVPSAAASKTTSASTIASRTSQVSSVASKRVSSVGTASSKTSSTTTSTTVTKTATAVKSSSATSRTSTISKAPSSTPAAGLRKTSTTPNKKPISSPPGKTGVKPTAGKTVPTKVTVPEKVAPVVEEATNNHIMDLDKQLKDDNNQLITKNGIDSQMMVIDSAAD